MCTCTSVCVQLFILCILQECDGDGEEEDEITEEYQSDSVSPFSIHFLVHKAKVKCGQYTQGHVLYIYIYIYIYVILYIDQTAMLYTLYCLLLKAFLLLSTICIYMHAHYS